MTGAILALDLGTQMGWALSTIDKKHVFGSGSQSFKLSRYDGGGVRFLRFSKFLSDILETAGPFSEIVYEEVRRHAGTYAAHVYGGFQSHLQAWAEIREIPYSSTPIGTWKRAVTGRGNASKQDVIDAVERLGHHPTDDNEADALGILLHKLSQV